MTTNTTKATKATKAKVAPAHEEVVEVAEATPAPTLSIGDLNAIATLVDTAVRRGAFQAKEMSAVGASFDKLIGFLSYVEQQQQQQQAEKTEGQ